MNLSRLQTLFIEALQGETPAELKTQIHSRQLSAEQCIELHRHNSRQTHEQALAEMFPVTEQLVGDEFFHQVAGEYDHSFPAETADLSHFGDRFPILLLKLTARHRELDKLRFLPELARLEWLLHYAETAADDRPFDFTTLRAVDKDDQDRVTFKVSHALNVMFSDYPVLSIWRAHQQRQPDALSLEGGSEWLCIYRQQDRPAIDVIPPTVATLLGEMMQGHPLGQLAEHFANLERHLPAMVRQGWLSGFYLADQAA
ncbi:HvfC/BufC N-terminal domain-containing protein [Marinobacterium arenosum]|uniref:HvfC/BufC N-terminal domain-containing protein n=1 Tax=Marinobacterium arenosum TaxID=2862496 RepID=UPI001C944B5E|nr:DNA-binding domain-containing protein [Marinobacterium arenosum]MBY4675449.1 putative DNA-binding domain-containing protein [Marinobacterium arenosum]